MPIPTKKSVSAAIGLLNDTYLKNQKKFKKTGDLSDTVTDPMSVLVHAVFSGVKNNDDWFVAEKSRRIDKAFTNKIGSFHENILSSIPGWEKPDGGFDLKCESRKIIVEIKNKHNTMNSSSANDTAERCKRYHQSNRDWTIYLAQIVPKKGRVNKPWETSKMKPNERIRVVDGATLYDMVTGEKNALRRVYAMIPGLIREMDSKLELASIQISMVLKAYDECYG